MPRLSFPIGLEGTEDLPRTRRDLQNCFNTGEDRVISRPGIELIDDIIGVARGQFVWNEALYQVKSNNLIKITNTDTGAFSVIGTIAGSANIEFDIGFNEAVIVVKGGALYTLDASDTLVDISGNANFVPCVDVAHINGRFVYIPADGDPAFFSDIGAAGTVQALSFFDAEELPDKNSAVFNAKNTLYIGGTDSFELFIDTGASPNPFIRINRSRILNGFIGALLEYSDTFLFIGREKDQDQGIYAIGQGGAIKISNERIDLLLSTYTLTELQDVVPGRFKWRGYDVAVFSFARDTIGFINNTWFTLSTLVNNVVEPWTAGFITQFNKEYFIASSARFGRLAKINTDYGDPIPRIIDTVLVDSEDDFFTIQSIQLGIAQGFNALDKSVALQMSRDNVIYGPFVYRNLGSIGEYGMKLRWNPPGGLGNYEGFAGIRFYTTEDIDFSTDYIIAKIR